MSEQKDRVDWKAVLDGEDARSSDDVVAAAAGRAVLIVAGTRSIRLALVVLGLGAAVVTMFAFDPPHAQSPFLMLVFCVAFLALVTVCSVVDFIIGFFSGHYGLAEWALSYTGWPSKPFIAGTVVLLPFLLLALFWRRLPWLGRWRSPNLPVFRRALWLAASAAWFAASALALGNCAGSPSQLDTRPRMSPVPVEAGPPQRVLPATRPVSSASGHGNAGNATLMPAAELRPLIPVKTWTDQSGLRLGDAEDGTSLWLSRDYGWIPFQLYVRAHEGEEDSSKILKVWRAPDGRKLGATGNGALFVWSDVRGWERVEKVL